MKSLIKRVAILALIVLGVILLHSLVQKEAEQEAPDAGAQPEEAAQPDAARSMAIVRVGEGVDLGRIEENPDGGVRVTVPAADGTEQTYTFTDVASDSRYAPAVNFAVSAGLMTGVSGRDLFHPEYGVLREDFAAILYRFTNGTPVEPVTAFDDVPADSGYYDAVNWVTRERLIPSVEPAVFGVGRFMKCEQVLVSLYRVAGEPETDGALTDYPYAAKVSDSGRSAVDWAWKSGLITEEDECVWYPTQSISRAQAALLLMRLSAMP